LGVPLFLSFYVLIIPHGSAFVKRFGKKIFEIFTVKNFQIFARTVKKQNSPRPGPGRGAEGIKKWRLLAIAKHLRPTLGADATDKYFPLIGREIREGVLHKFAIFPCPNIFDISKDEMFFPTDGADNNNACFSSIGLHFCTSLYFQELGGR
jgi:hypothetical protein